MQRFQEIQRPVDQLVAQVKVPSMSSKKQRIPDKRSRIFMSVSSRQPHVKADEAV